MTPELNPPKRAWSVVALLWFVVCSNYLARIMLTTMHGSIIASFSMTERQFGLLTAVFLWTYGLLSPLGGFVADRFSRRAVIIASMCTWSAVTFLTSYARNFEELVILRALMGFAEACYQPAALALIADYHRGPTRSLATGVHQTGVSVGLALGGLGGWLAEQLTWRNTFSLVGLIGLSYGLMLLFVLRDAPQENQGGVAGPAAKPQVRVTEAAASLFSSGAYILALVNWAVVGVTSWTIFGWMPVFLQERFHLEQGAAGLDATVYSNLAALPGLLIAGAWADRWRRTNGRARMLVPAIGLLIAAPCVLMTANAGLIAFGILGMIGYRFFGNFMDANMMPILCEIVDQRYRATGFGLINMVGTIAGGLGIYAAGALRDMRFSMETVFVIVAALTALSPVLLYLMKPGNPGGVRSAG